MTSPLMVMGRCAVVLFVAGSVLLQYHVKRLPPASGSARSGKLESKQAPDFELPDLSGQTVSLAALRQKGPVVVDFFMVDCMPCRMGWASLVAMHTQSRPKPITVVAINLGDPREKLDRFLTKFPAPFPVLTATSEVQRAYSIEAVPRTLLIDTDGSVVFDFVGQQSALPFLVDAFLKGELPPSARRTVRSSR